MYEYITTESFTNEKSSHNKEIEDAEYEKSMNKLYCMREPRCHRLLLYVLYRLF